MPRPDHLVVMVMVMVGLIRVRVRVMLRVIPPAQGVPELAHSGPAEVGFAVAFQ